MIKIEKVTKLYGQTVAVRDISFEVAEGEILGFLGPNGAGKTTTMRVITGYFPPTDGNVFVAGHSVLDEPLEVKRQIGYVPENPAMYHDMRTIDYLKFIGAVKGVTRTSLKERLNKTIELCALKSVVNKRVGELSRGFKQRVALGQALINDPPVLILDEPTSGLDPKQIFEIRQLIKSMAGERTIVLSTHILPEVSMTCSKVVIINEGEIVAVDTTENLGKSFVRTHQVELVVKGPSKEIKNNLKKIDGIGKVDNVGERYTVEMEKDKDLRSKIAKQVVQNGFELLELKSRSMSLEDVFIKLVTEEEEGDRA
ncbi:MAG: ATP-binding cassette domain-containing protein [Spirochaetota bacterium]|nr:MAG: ATP-binding cassette domain-containing protein [Spirochaetota bacterium]